MDFRLTLGFSLPCTVVQLLVCSAFLLHFGSTNYIDYTSVCDYNDCSQCTHNDNWLHWFKLWKLWLFFSSTQLLLYTSTLPVATQSLHPIYRTTRKGWSRWSARSSWLGWNTRREGRHCNSLCRMNIPANIWTWGVCYLCTVTNNFWQHFWCWQMHKGLFEWN